MEHYTGRTPYILLNFLDEMWEGARGKYFVLTDDFVYPHDPYVFLLRLQTKLPSKLSIYVEHTDGRRSVIEKGITTVPFRLYEVKKTLYAGSRTGYEKIFIRLGKVFDLDPLPEEEFEVDVYVGRPPLKIIIRRRGRVGRRVIRRTTTLPQPRKVRTLGVLGDYEKYKYDLRSIFSAYHLDFGRKHDRNLILTEKVAPSKIHYDGDIHFVGDLDRIIPLGLDFTFYFRTNLKFTHDCYVFGGLKVS